MLKFKILFADGEQQSYHYKELPNWNWIKKLELIDNHKFYDTLEFVKFDRSNRNFNAIWKGTGRIFRMTGRDFELLLSGKKSETHQVSISENGNFQVIGTFMFKYRGCRVNLTFEQ